jgi:hypothetical protein
MLHLGSLAISDPFCDPPTHETGYSPAQYRFTNSAWLCGESHVRLITGAAWW